VQESREKERERERERSECGVFKMMWKVDNMFGDGEELTNSVLEVSNHLKSKVANS
jgi:hypothetical protein